RLPPPPSSSLFPYTTLFRSATCWRRISRCRIWWTGHRVSWCSARPRLASVVVPGCRRGRTYDDNEASAFQTLILSTASHSPPRVRVGPVLSPTSVRWGGGRPLWSRKSYYGAASHF